MADEMTPPLEIIEAQCHLCKQVRPCAKCMFFKCNRKYCDECVCQTRAPSQSLEAVVASKECWLCPSCTFDCSCHVCATSDEYVARMQGLPSNGGSSSRSSRPKKSTRSFTSRMGKDDWLFPSPHTVIPPEDGKDGSEDSEDQHKAKRRKADTSVSVKELPVPVGLSQSNPALVLAPGSGSVISEQSIPSSTAMAMETEPDQSAHVTDDSANQHALDVSHDIPRNDVSHDVSLGTDSGMPPHPSSGDGVESVGPDSVKHAQVLADLSQAGIEQERRYTIDRPFVDTSHHSASYHHRASSSSSSLPQFPQRSGGEEDQPFGLTPSNSMSQGAPVQFPQRSAGDEDRPFGDTPPYSTSQHAPSQFNTPSQLMDPLHFPRRLAREEYRQFADGSRFVSTAANGQDDASQFCNMPLSRWGGDMIRTFADAARYRVSSHGSQLMDLNNDSDDKEAEYDENEEENVDEPPARLQTTTVVVEQLTYNYKITERDLKGDF
mmetsp:Transcript_2027/g.3583  ORF Transcript_2027/g.3583 Transcript_2027/m.3583 type:complete len:492 (+) Transcript_2027:3-1478(+)